MKLPCLAICLFLVTVTTACSSSRSVIGTARDSEAVGHYAIPKGILKLTIEFKYPEAALLNIAALAPGNVSLYTETIEVEYIPAAYIPLRYDPSAFSTDSLTIDIDNRGFLTQVAIDVEDQSSAFISRLLDIGKLAVKIDQYPATVLEISSGFVTQKINVYVDPYSTGKSIDAIPSIPGDEIQIGITAAGVPMRGTLNPSASSVAKTIVTNCANSICYPAMVSKLVTLTGPAGTMEEQMIIVPDPSHMIKIDLKRAAAVKKTLTADFSTGVLSKLTLNKPSEALSIASIPFDVLSAIFAIPTELIQLKIDTSAKEKDLVKAQKDLIDAQQQLLEAVEKAKKDAAAANPDKQGPYE